MPFESLDILDWYDGPVIALARLPNRPSLYLASLIAWSIEECRRAFALIELTDADVAKFRAGEHDEWEIQHSTVRTFVDRHAGDAIVIGVDRDNEIVRELIVPIEEVRSQLIGDVEAALAAERAAWLSRLF